MTVRDVLDKDPLSGFDRQIIAAEVSSRFNEFLTTRPSSRLIGSLYPFASQPPFRYWDSDTVTLALAQLEKNRSRTLDAIRIRRGVLDRGIQSLFRLSTTALIEDKLDVTNPQDLVRLSSEFLPDYLRLAEHVFMNLLELYWSVLKKGGAEGGFDSSKAVARIKALQLERLLRGYCAEVRNAIAHGKVNFTGVGIEFGVERPEVLSASDFLHYYDDLRRTCNSLVIALLLFWERISPADKLGGSVPTALVERFAAGAVDRAGLKLLGIVESTTPLAGKQLHVALRMDMRQRTMVFAYVAYVARQLIEAGAEGYDRFVVQVDHGLGVSSLVIVKSRVLEGLLKDEAPADRLPEAFPDTQLLWFSEGKWKTRLRVWQTILRTGLAWLRKDILRRWHEQGIWIGKGRYRIREVELLGSQGISRVRVRAVLKDPTDASNVDVVRAILADIITIYRRRLARSRSQYLDSGLPWPKFPAYIWVDLYRVDGTIRWLRRDGWLGGNLVAVAEALRGSAKPVLVEEPQDIYKGIRIRYSMDTEKAQQALSDLAQFVSEFRKTNSE